MRFDWYRVAFAVQAQIREGECLQRWDSDFIIGGIASAAEGAVVGLGCWNTEMHSPTPVFVLTETELNCRMLSFVLTTN